MSGKPLSFWLRKIHKWIGLIIGVQLLLWTFSGAMMALLDANEVRNGGELASPEVHAAPPSGAWARVSEQLGAAKVSGVTTASLPAGPALAVSTDQGVRLFHAASGDPLKIDRDTAAIIATSYHPDADTPSAVTDMDKVTLAVRDHALPIWQVDFDDEAARTFYISGTTGELLEARNRSFRIFDVMWMLHTMDYVGRDNFNHPIIIMFGFAAAWLAITGFWLLFKTMWRHDISWLKRRFSRAQQS